MINSSILKQAFHQANLAPSSHNCQPWMSFIVESTQQQQQIKEQLQLETLPVIIFGLDKNRCLSSLPIHQREMHLSLGAYIQAFLEALTPTLEPITLWVSDDSHQNPIQKNTADNFVPLMVLSFKSITPKTNQTRFAGQLASRRTHRLQYQNTAPSKKQLDMIQHAFSYLDPNQTIKINQSIHLDQSSIDQFCYCIKKHANKEFTDQYAWKETYQYFRWNKEHGEESGDGFRITHVLGAMNQWMVSIYRRILSPKTMKILSRLKIPTLLAADMSKKFHSSKAIFSLSFNSEAPSIHEEIVAGSYLLNFWLRAEQQNLSIWPCSILLQHEDSRLECQSRLKLKGTCFFTGKIGSAINKHDPAPRHQDPLNNVFIIND